MSIGPFYLDREQVYQQGDTVEVMSMFFPNDVPKKCIIHARANIYNPIWIVFTENDEKISYPNLRKTFVEFSDSYHRTLNLTRMVLIEKNIYVINHGAINEEEIRALKGIITFYEKLNL